MDNDPKSTKTSTSDPAQEMPIPETSSSDTLSSDASAASAPEATPAAAAPSNSFASTLKSSKIKLGGGSSKGFKIATIVLAVLLAGAGTYILIDLLSGNNSETCPTTAADAKPTTPEATEKPESDSEVDSSTPTVAEKPAASSFDFKSLDDPEGRKNYDYYNVSRMMSTGENTSVAFASVNVKKNFFTSDEPPFSPDSGFSVDSTTFTITLNYRNNPYNIIQDREDLVETITLSQPAQFVKIDGFGQAAGDECIFFLMADGTVQYIYIHDALEAGKIQVKTVEGVSGVSMVEGSGAGSMGSPTGWYHTVLAIRPDGNFYDLQKHIPEVAR